MYKSVFKKFSYLEGSQHIASEYALKGVERLIRTGKIRTVFEFGIGIGTIPYLIATLNNNCLYTGTESNNFCIKALNKNLEGILDKESFNHIENYNDYSGGKADLIIIDGKFNDYLFLKKICHKNTLIIIEGDRKEQKDFIAKAYPNALINFNTSISKNKSYSPFYNKNKNPFIGGYTLIRMNNNFMNRIKFLLNKIELSIKYRIRKFIR